jgi:hypothetical protein
MPSLPTAEGKVEPSQTGPGAKLRFPSWYDPYSTEGIERRRKLFEEIARNRTPETDDAMERLIATFDEDDDLQ